jgi:DNA-binding NarL/FixJ family response regulator
VARAALATPQFAASESAGRALSLEEAEAEASTFLTSLQAEERAARPAGAASEAGLTPREIDVLRLLVAGQSNPQIAEVLFISPRTASTHVTNILAKLGIGSRTEAAARAMREGLI